MPVEMRWLPALLALALTGCGLFSPTGAALESRASLQQALDARVGDVTEAGTLEQPMFRGTGTVFVLSGSGVAAPAEVSVFEYASAAEAQADAANITPEGNTKTTMIEWVAPPHFFRKDRVIALYVGSDPAVLQALTDVMGPQFAGR